jgi:Na+-translocating ferredoxin:NAD+ oxidoreductase RnfD subunit
MSAPGAGIDRVLPSLAAAVVTAGVMDALILRLLRHRQTHAKWEYPSGAVLSALFIAMVMSPLAPWYVSAAASAIAVSSKYLLRTRAGNVLNPAALAIVAVFYLFDTAQSWWGALPDLPVAAIVVLVATGIFIADRVNRMPLVLAFLGCYFLLFSATAYFGDPRLVAEIFRAPDVHAVLFFAFFFLTDPPTSPVRYGPQIACAVIVAIASFLIFETSGAVHFLLSGILIGNVYEAWNRGRPLTLAHLRPRLAAAVAMQKRPSR